MMKLLRLRGMPPDIEVGVTVGICYLLFYVVNAPLQLSGVIAVVVYGLYGSATLKWEMSAAASQEGFPKFWDVFSQVRCHHAHLCLYTIQGSSSMSMRLL
jgi:NhaP-type Na+/H+ or K+/H+ antiporter